MEAEDTTQRLICYWRAGCRQSGDQLLRRYVPVLRRYFARRAPADVDDLIQCTLLACVQGVERFEGRGSFKSYVLGIAHHQLLRSLRAEASVELAGSGLSTRPEETPSQLAALRQEQSILVMALLGLPSKFLTVLKLYYWDQRVLEEIAIELGVPVGTVKSRLARARAVLREAVVGMPVRAEVRDGALRELVSWLESHRDLRRA